MLAARTNRTTTLALLLERDADVNATGTEDGNTALMLAANRGFLDIVRLLLAAGADVNIRAKDGWTALAAAEMVGDAEIAELIRKAGAKH